MSFSRFHKKCPGCSRVFSIESSNSGFCADCEKDVKHQLEREPNRTCSICHVHFFSPNIVKRCPFCSKKGYSDLNLPEKTYDNTKEKKTRNHKPISYEELNRRLEYKRVMDDEGWEHYLKGRKWDRI